MIGLTEGTRPSGRGLCGSRSATAPARARRADRLSEGADREGIDVMLCGGVALRLIETSPWS
jgi:hypothetical protein